MTIEVRAPGVDELAPVVDAVRSWQYEGAPMQLHPGDLGWFQRFGAAAAATADAVRLWRLDGRIVAVGLLDGPALLRMTMAPDRYLDVDLAQRLADDLAAPDRGVLPAGPVSVEVPAGLLLHDLLTHAGWDFDEPWTPLRRDLREPVEAPDLRVEPVGADTADCRAAVQRAAFDGSRFTAALWHEMAAGSAYAEGRCLLAFDDRGAAVAAVTVWSAGRGRPGLLEPMGVHRDHRGLGYGRAITVAAAAALQQMGSSSAIVCTPRANVGGVTTYVSAGFDRLPDVHDRIRRIAP